MSGKLLVCDADRRNFSSLRENQGIERKCTSVCYAILLADLDREGARRARSMAEVKSKGGKNPFRAETEQIMEQMDVAGLLTSEVQSTKQLRPRP